MSMTNDIRQTRIEKVSHQKKTSRKTSTMPADLAEKVPSRLAMAALVYASTYIAAMGTGEFVSHVIGDAEHDMNIGHLIAAIFITTSLAVFFVARSRKLNFAQTVDLGLTFEVIASFGIGLALFATPYEPNMVLFGISWICIWIISYPLIVPSAPHRALVASLLSASMGPLALFFTCLSPTTRCLPWTSSWEHPSPTISVLGSPCIRPT